MSANGEEREDLVVLVDEEGREHNFRMIDMFQVNEREYAVLVPCLFMAEETPGEETDFDEAYIFRVEFSGDEETLLEVEDEDEWDEVAAVWEERLEAFDYEDDDEEEPF